MLRLNSHLLQARERRFLPKKRGDRERERDEEGYHYQGGTINESGEELLDSYLGTNPFENGDSRGEEDVGPD